MPEQAAQAGAQGQEGGSSVINTAIKGVGFFMLSQFLINQFMGPKQQNNANVAQNFPIPPFAERPDQSTIENINPIPNQLAPIWPTNSTLDISVYISPSMIMPSLKSAPKESLVLDAKNFTLGDYNDDRVFETSFFVPKAVQENGTLWAHFYVGLTGRQLDPNARDYKSDSAVYVPRPLTQYLPKKKVAKLKNLLSDSTEPGEVEDDTPKVSIVSYYHPNFTLSAIPDSGVLAYRSLHPAVRQQLQVERTGARDASGQNGWYYPILYLNTFWQLRSQMTELNSTVKELPLRISLNNLANWKFNIIASIDDNVKQTARQAATGGPMPAGGDGSEWEMLKEVLLNTNIWLLGTTGVVSVLHMIFETLAFKNDISHWRKKKDIVGTSVRTIFANIFMQLVIFLYLLDNSENTSWMILAGQGFGILLEAWKVTKTVDVRVRPPPEGSRFSWLPYHVVFEDKHKLTETEQKTKEYDEIAFNYLYIVAVPLLLAYAGYSLVYETHKSWYSFVIATLVGSVYAYGFLMMVPSLYINYRLKSVAHMPAKAMTYKFLNTFIDDLFAFTIKMPTLHRLATLRDDIIFFVYLYQSWKYKVDYTRVNEFGQGGEDDDNVEEVKGEEQKEKKITEAETKPESATKASGKNSSAGARKRK